MRLLKLAAVAAILILLTLMLGPFGAAEARIGSDKLGHIVAFAVIAGSLAVLRPRWSLPVIACAAFAIGVAVEIIQGLTGRDADIADVLADMAGIALATFVLMSSMAVRFRARIP
ncbi:MAG TPA: VanZ family protein [Brevundimonas sp.]